MKLSGKEQQSKDIFSDVLPQAIASLKKNIITPIFGGNLLDKYKDEQPPFRSDLFTIEQIEQYAQKLAKSHVLIEGRPSEHLLERLAENENILLEVHELLSDSIKQDNRIVPAGEWLLDNFYLIEEQVYTAKKHLPKGYSKGLPQLAKGTSEGLPRVYDMAIEILSHTDGRIDFKTLSSFIGAYQKTTVLRLGELWAIPIMLRLALLENLRRLSTQIATNILNKNLADKWADDMTNTAENDPKNLVVVIADMVRSNPPMESSFVAELTRRLQGKGPSLALPLSWVEQNLSENGLTSTELVQLENQKQAADQVSISNSIVSLRFLNTTNWREFVEEESIVEKILSQDPANVYTAMDFYTRDVYRHAVEKISKNSYLSEQDVAKLVVKSAERQNEQEHNRYKHVGYYLIDKGLEQVEKVIKVKLPFGDKLRRLFCKAPLFFYLGGIAIVTFLLSWLFINKAYYGGLQNWKIFALAAVSIVAVSQLANTIINWLSTQLAKPSLLPRMDFSKGIADDIHALVVVPTLLTSIKDTDSLTEDLEVRFLANRDRNLHFALLTDFKDATSETLPEDKEILQALSNKIIAMNKKYCNENNEYFFLFHRPRKWNEQEKAWMGYERKRGKIAALNALLRGNGRENFSEIIADYTVFPQIKYVITLDTDTRLPRDAAWKMVGTMAHPLNHALYSEEKQCVVDGYSILQPRVSNSLPGAKSSFYAKIHGNEPGTDPYTRAISDVYQDLFKEGSFIGKGIYDVDAFEHALNGRFPDNRILSHDLVEGCYSRSGLMSDIQLYEDYPSHYNVDVKRRHRWIRGDWQIARWLFPNVPSPNKQFRKNPLSALSRWKIFDNLRRSLVPLCMILLLSHGWLTGSAWFWTVAVLLIFITPAVLNFLWELGRKPKDVILLQHVIYTVKSTGDNLLQQLLDFAFLPYEAYINTDAIVRTGWRMFISKKKLLEWNPSNSTINSIPKSLLATYGTMWIAPLFAVAMLFYLMNYSSLALIIELPVLILWTLSPAIAWLVSLIENSERVALSEQQTIFLRKLSRKIWAFFEKFVNVDDNWLPPDNYQEHPTPRTAHRTSPTNIGLSLLSNLTAYDFGYISSGKLVERTTNTLNTVQSMEKYRGHLYNWYDTTSLLPLSPRYISTVDSGNFIGHLITLRQGLLTLPQQKIFALKSFDGLMDTVNVLQEKKEHAHLIEPFKKELEGIISSYPETLTDAKGCMDILEDEYAHIIGSYKFEGQSKDEPLTWIELLGQQIRDIHNDLNSLAPWVSLQSPTEKFNETLSLISAIPNLIELTKVHNDLLPRIKSHYSSSNSTEENQWLDAFTNSIIEASRRAKDRILIIEKLAAKCQELAAVDYDFLYDQKQNLFSIGYNAEEHRKDNSFYDLLASEARLGIFIAIAQGKIPQEGWFALGRQLTSLGTTPVLISWSASMFEYLMPILVMPSYDNTLLSQTHKTIVQKQIDYGKKRNVPWGISESGYNLVDTDLNYQYRAFGVPGLGLKRGLAEDLVISPYSTIMALMVMPNEAYDNLLTMFEEGFQGDYGFYEAIDYTVSRLPRGQENVVIRSFMAHHQGMSLLSLAYLLLEQPMQKRFEADVEIQSTLLLLQERIPRVSTFYSPTAHVSDTNVKVDNANEVSMRVINTPHTPIPEIQLLSNGRYNVMVTNAGGGYSRWKDMAVTRWREDTTCDNWGAFCFIRDLENNASWSTAYQPLLQEGDNYEAVFSQGRAEFRRKDHQLETHTEIVVSPEDDVELRRVHITNRSRKKRIIEVTSYAEVVLNNQNADLAHTAFSNLFVQTEILEQRNAILCTRRPRSESEHPPTMFHLMKVHHAKNKQVSYETNRTKFIGRGNTIHHPDAINHSDKLSNSQGSVLDPIISIQYRFELDPLQTTVIDMVIGIGDTKDVANFLIEKYQDKFMADRAFELSWTHSQVVLRQINAFESDAQLYGRLASSVIYTNPALRADTNVILRNNRGQSGLWSYSISGDLPIVLVQVESLDNIELVKQMIQAHAYWRLKGLIVDLVIWNEDHGGYRQTLQNQILGLIAPTISVDMKEQPGGVFIRSADQVSNEDRVLFQTVARLVISDKFGSLEEQLSRRTKVKAVLPYFTPTKFHPSVSTSVELPNNLQFFNGIGGFAENGKEYVIFSKSGKTTPAPWSNVLANPNFGCIISESGQSYTWIDNAHEFRLTPWNNDPVSDLAGEAFYVRDEESGKFWSPTPLQSRGKTPYITRHGFGYSSFEHSEDGIDTNMTIFVDLEDAVKFIVIKFNNQSGRHRKLSATGYVEWVMGEIRSKIQMHTITETDITLSSIFARNCYNTELENRTGFFEVDDTITSYTTDRTEFIGRNGSLRNPEAMNKSKLSGKYGAALDPCAALQIVFDVADNAEYEIIFKLGAGRDKQNAIELIKQYKGREAVYRALENVKNYWNQTLTAVQIETPDTALNIISNGWLNYQALACRIWGRSGFYQSGGAFGFRDQLQDVLSLMHNKPEIAREQILLNASRQFKEGDAQHWWHPPINRGVRTTCSDDYLWLPFVTARYVYHTGDEAILDENVSFIEGRLLNVGEESSYDLPLKSTQSASLYVHCMKAIENGLNFGEHGLPLMGSGDWNDGMDKVGEHGKGESVWLAFFLYDTLMHFSEVAISKNDTIFHDRCIEEAKKLQSNIEQYAWDGSWYRRAYFDDGTPLGSITNDECKIDSIAQSWSVLSKAGNKERSAMAMKSAAKHLIREEKGFIQLFEPPFDKSIMNPGYIKGYVPGVRENGGQYTHAAIWLIMGFAALKDKRRVWELLKMVNPINRSVNENAVETYKVEPYVMAADVYAEPSNLGRGGWTWYTGSAGWTYQLILEYVLGIKRKGNELHFDPCIPEEWASFKINYTFRSSVYEITLSQDQEATKNISLTINGVEHQEDFIKLEDNNGRYIVQILLHETETVEPSIPVPVG